MDHLGEKEVMFGAELLTVLTLLKIQSFMSIRGQYKIDSI